MKAIRSDWVVQEVMKELNEPAWTHGDIWPLYLSRKQRLENQGGKLDWDHRKAAERMDKMRKEQPGATAHLIGREADLWSALFGVATNLDTNRQLLG